VLFPMTQPPRTLMMGAPSEVSPQHLPSAYPGGEARLTRNAPSLEQGKIQGKRRKWCFRGAIAAPIRHETQSLTRKFPTEDEQGIWRREAQDNWEWKWAEEGIRRPGPLWVFA